MPKAGVDEDPKAGMELPNAGDDDAPKVVVEENEEEGWAAPNTPVEVPPNSEPPVWEPKGVGLPKEDLGANGLLLGLVWPNGLLAGCPKGLVVPNIFVYIVLILRNSLISNRKRKVFSAPTKSRIKS